MTEQSSIYQIWPKKFWFIKYDQRKLDLSNTTEDCSIYQIWSKKVRFIKYDRRNFDLSNMTEKSSIYQIRPKTVRSINYDWRQLTRLSKNLKEFQVKIWRWQCFRFLILSEYTEYVLQNTAEIKIVFDHRNNFIAFIRPNNSTSKFSWTNSHIPLVLVFPKCGLTFLCFQNYRRYKELSSELDKLYF